MDFTEDITRQGKRLGEDVTSHSTTKKARESIFSINTSKPDLKLLKKAYDLLSSKEKHDFENIKLWCSHNLSLCPPLMSIITSYGVVLRCSPIVDSFTFTPQAQHMKFTLEKVQEMLQAMWGFSFEFSQPLVTTRDDSYGFDWNATLMALGKKLEGMTSFHKINFVALGIYGMVIIPIYLKTIAPMVIALFEQLSSRFSGCIELFTAWAHGHLRDPQFEALFSIPVKDRKTKDWHRSLVVANVNDVGFVLPTGNATHYLAPPEGYHFIPLLGIHGGSHFDYMSFPTTVDKVFEAHEVWEKCRMLPTWKENGIRPQYEQWRLSLIAKLSLPWETISLTLSTLTTSSVPSLACLIPTIPVPPVPIPSSTITLASYPPFEMNNPTLPTITPLTLNIPPLMGQVPAIQPNPLVDMLRPALEERKSKEVNHKLQQLEEALKAMQGPQSYGSIDLDDLCYYSGIQTNFKFKQPDFDKYDGSGCPYAHLQMYARKMVPYANDERAKCEYHNVVGHGTENCAALRHRIQDLIDEGKLQLDVKEAKGVPNITQNHLPPHDASTMNTITFNAPIAQMSLNVLPMMIDDVVMCLYHSNMKGHALQDCKDFQRKIKELQGMGVLRFTSTQEVEKFIAPVTEEYFTKERPYILQDTTKAQVMPQCSTILNSTTNDVFNMTRSGQCYVNPEVEELRKVVLKSKDIRIEEMPEESPKKLVLENEVAEFLNILRKSEYSIIEQLNKTPTKISVLELMLSSGVHLDTLLKVLKEAYMLKNIDTQKFVTVVEAILAPNYINFSNDEIPNEGNGHTKALHISVQLDESHINQCNIVVCAFDGTKRNVVGKIELLVEIGLVTFDVDFFVMDVSPAFNMLLGRPWIHVSGTVTSTLHQKVKYIVNGVLVTVNGKEEHVIRKATTIPYLGIDPGTYESFYHSMECVVASYIHPKFKGKWAEMAKPAKVAAKIMLSCHYQLGEGLGLNGQGILEPIEEIQTWGTFGLGYKPKKEDWQRMRDIKAKKRLARLQGRDTRDEPKWVPHIRVTFPQPVEILCSSLDGYVMKHMDVLYVDLEGTIFTNRLLEIGECAKQAKFEDVVVEDITDEVCSDDEEDNFGFNSLFGPANMTYPKERGRRILLKGHSWRGTPTSISFIMQKLQWDHMIHAIPLYSRAKPIKQRLSRMKPEVLLKVKEEVQKLLDVNFIEVAMYPKWVANIVPIMKKDGQVRVYVDYRDLNKASPKVDFPLPHIQILLDNAAKNSRLMATLGATYQHLLITLLHDFVHTIVELYVDDMVIMSKEKVLHTKNLKKVLERLRKHQLRLNPAKCTFDVDFGKLPGIIVSRRGIEIDPTKIKAIDEIPPPKTQKEIRSFLGRINYIARFIANLTTICEPIFKLLRKDNPYTWNDQCQQAFDKTKEYLKNPSILVPPTDKRPFILYITVLGESMGAVLVQHEDLVEVEFDSDNWKLFFEGVVNQLGCGLGAMLVSPKGDHFPIAIKLDFACTNNIAKYKACIARIHAALDMNFLQNGEYHLHAFEVNKKTIKKLAPSYFLSRNTLYKHSADMTLLRCVEETKAKQVMTEVHEGICGTHANGRMLARKILRAGYYWLTMEHDYIKYTRAFNPKASNGHQFILVATDYFTKWVEATSYASVTKKVVTCFIKREIICRYGQPEAIITDNASNLNNDMMTALYKTSVRTSIGATPYSLVYGMEAVLPIDLEIPSMRILSESGINEEDLIQKMIDYLNLLDEKRLAALCHGQCYQRRMVAAYNKKVKPRVFHQGDIILRKIMPNERDPRGKFTPNYEGPYVIKQAFSKGALLLRYLDGIDYHHLVNANAVKMYYC
ncbi:hypothetical protein SLEP1_g8408 [Rubroshorea leprosula]|uniref:G-patch domain-containing protein n=1 Tax=Rubroshorea leprosula TaxID=152421 RepID=A0AAV5ICI6_9ROSI|nr:hypothetical protein SLEP1_g8408 [Rubroshorea leprosula]